MNSTPSKEALKNTSTGPPPSAYKSVDDAGIKDTTFNAGFWEVFLMAMGIVLSGTCTSWNYGLHCGFLSYLTCTAFISVGYFCLSSCLAELTSITNFAGGNYGYSRCSLGPSYGFVLACCELMGNNLFTLAQINDISKAVTFGFRWSADVQPLVVLITYILLMSVHLRGGPYFWYSVTGFAIVTILLVLLYLISAMVKCKFIYVVSLDERDRGGFHDGFVGLMNSMMYAAWFFVGIDAITVTGAKISNGTEVIPKVLITSNIVFVIVAFWTLSVVFFGFDPVHAASELYESSFPMSLGYYDHLHFSERTGALMTIPPLFGSSLGFFYAAKHALHAMSLSSMASPWFRPVYGPGQVPWRSVAVSVCVQYLLYLIFFYTHHTEYIFEFTILGACCSYGGVFWAYLTFKERFPNMTRGISIPNGNVLAYIGLFVFGVLFISVVGFRSDAVIVVVSFFVFLFLVLLYYYRVVESRQFLSHEEQKKFMKAYILNANKMKKKNKLAGSTWYRSLRTKVVGGVVTLLRGYDASSRQQQQQLGTTTSRSRGDPSAVPLKSHDPAITEAAEDQHVEREHEQHLVDGNVLHHLHDPSAHLGHKVLPVQGEGIELGAVVSHDASQAVVRPGEPTHTHVHHDDINIVHHDPDEEDPDVQEPVVVTIPIQQLDPGSAKRASVKVTWSGRMMNTRQSRQFFALTQSEGDMNFIEQLAALDPAVFSVEMDHMGETL